jgi:hypothetical protein
VSVVAVYVAKQTNKQTICSSSSGGGGGGGGGGGRQYWRLLSMDVGRGLPQTFCRYWNRIHE